MPLERQYTSWAAVKGATGTPSSRNRAVWREHLRSRPAIVYWGDSWFRTPLYRNLSWHSFIRIDGIALKLGAPGLLASRMCTPANCRNTAERIASCEFDLLAISIGGNDALDQRLDAIFRKHSARLDADFTENYATREEGFWYDEIHPTEAGFGVLAEGFNAKVREVLAAAGKVGAVG